MKRIKLDTDWNLSAFKTGIQMKCYACCTNAFFSILHVKILTCLGRCVARGRIYFQTVEDGSVRSARCDKHST